MAEKSKKRRPSILFLMSDEHRADISGYAGNRTIRTSLIDKLAESGVVFSNAYTPSPISVPARQSMMSGKLPRTTGCECYHQDLPPGYLTFAKHFSRYAYTTVACGKLHHHGQDMSQGWMRRIGMDDMMEPMPQHVDGVIQEELAKYPKPEYWYWGFRDEVKRAGVGTSPYSVWDDYATDGAIHFLRESFCSPFYDKTMDHKPLMLYIGLNNPHFPFYTDEDRFNYYLNRVTPIEQTVPAHPVLGSETTLNERVITGKDVSEREVKRAMAAYYGNIESNDRRYEKVLNFLEEIGQNIDDWIVIYTADHGEMLGEHGSWGKEKFYEASVRVPLIIRYPARFRSGVVNENVNLCDLFATLCELSGLPIPEGLDSRSLVPLLEGDADGWDNETVSQFKGEHLMIKWGDLKYQYYGEEIKDVLFDLSRDPHEDINLIDDPEYASVVTKFRKRRHELAFGPDASRDYKNAGYSAEKYCHSASPH